MPNKSTCMHTLQHLLETNQIAKVRRGLYEIIPTERIGKQKPVADKFLLGRKIVEPYCFAYHTALELHGVANSAMYNTVYVASPSQFRSFAYDGVEFKWTPRRQLTGSEYAIWRTSRIRVTDGERTIVDCLDRVDLAGGFEELYKSLLAMRNVNPQRLRECARMTGKKVILNKLGFFLSLPRIREVWSIDEIELAKLREGLSPRIFYFETSKGQGRLSREWNLIVPNNIEELMALA